MGRATTTDAPHDRAPAVEPGASTGEPTLKVSIVLPGVHQASLELALAALCAQTYPAELLEVLVTADSYNSGIHIPDLAPPQSRLVACDGPGVTGADGLRAALDHANGDVILRLGPALLLSRSSVEAHMRWHCGDEPVVVQGVAGTGPGTLQLAPAEAHQAVADDTIESLLPTPPAAYRWAADVTGVVPGSDFQPYEIIPADRWPSVSWPVAIYEQVGGLDEDLPIGHEIDLCYRMGQAGARSIVEPAAKGWLVGPDEPGPGDELREHLLRVVLQQRVPLMRKWRAGSVPRYRVPYVDVLVDTTNHSYDLVERTVGSVLAGTLPDVTVTMVGPWNDMGSTRALEPDDPRIELRSIYEALSCDHRVEFRTTVAATSAPAPFRLSCAAGFVLAPDALARLTELAESEGYGLVMIAVMQGSQLTIARLERTQAVARGLAVCGDTPGLLDTVADMSGVYWLDGYEWVVGKAVDHSSSWSVGHLRSELDKWKRIANRRQERLDNATAEIEQWKHEVSRRRHSRARITGRLRGTELGGRLGDSGGVG